MMLKVGILYPLTLLIVFIIYRLVKWRNLIITAHKFPGPKKLPIIHNMTDVAFLDNAGLFAALRTWAKKYGSIYCLTVCGFSAINISGPEEFEVIASTMKHIEKGIAYSFMEMWLGRGLLTNTGDEWQKRRKILTPAFHFSILQQFLQIFNDETEVLVEKLKEEATKPSTNLVPLISFTTLKTITNTFQVNKCTYCLPTMARRERLGIIYGDHAAIIVLTKETSCGTTLDETIVEHKKYISAIHKLGKIIAYRSARPWLHNDYLFNTFTVLGWTYKSLVKTLHNFTNKIIEYRSKNFKTFEAVGDSYNYSERKKLAFLDLLLNAKISDGIIDDKGIRDEVNTFIFEGHDTVSVAICFTLMLLANHKDYQNILYEEIIKVLGDSNTLPDFNDLNELKIMERVIKESLRLYPSVPTITRNLDNDVTLNGLVLPKDVTAIHIFIYDLHRNPKYWPDPEKFDPDRFLPENCVGRHPYSYVPFSAGPRNCIGQKFAMLEMKAMLCGILKNFILEPVDTCQSLKFVADIILRTEDESIRVKFKPR